MAPGHDSESVHSATPTEDEDVIAGLYKPSFKRELCVPAYRLCSSDSRC